MQENIVEIVKEEVMKRCYSPNNKFGIGAWTHHIYTVYVITNNIASQYNADLEIVSLAALLHDIASVTDESYLESHHIKGAEIAEQFLKELNYPSDRTNKVKACILNHRGSVIKDKKSQEEICIADADAMAHFYNLPSLFSLVYKEQNMSIDDGVKFIKQKLDRSYNKLTKEGKEVIKEQYQSCNTILSNIQNNLI